MACNCYVRYLKEHVRFATRYGAHNPSCPWYRPSGDPVDRLKDEAFRAATERGRQETYKEACVAACEGVHDPEPGELARLRDVNESMRSLFSLQAP